MILWDWFENFLTYLGLWNKTGKLLFLGLDNAGKTSLMGVLKKGAMAYHQPTYHGTSEELSIRNIRITAYDLAGHVEARRVWRDYFTAVDGVVFLIDASDRARFRDSKTALDTVLEDDLLSQTPVLVLANKIDRPGAAGESEILHQFDLYGRTTGKEPDEEQIKMEFSKRRRPLEVFMCSLAQRQGYGEAFEWLAKFLD